MASVSLGLPLANKGEIMGLFYSKTTTGFYHTDMHGGNIPADAVPITDEEHASLLQGEAQGLKIAADGNGVPFLEQRTISLDEARAAQALVVGMACKQAIVGGFVSDALGSEHTYASKPEDQVNLIGAVASGLPSVDFWCADQDGAWSLAPHTAAQIHQVLADAAIQRMLCSAKLQTLTAAIDSANTVDQVAAVVW
jgi:hypothetical protein